MYSNDRTTNSQLNVTVNTVKRSSELKCLTLQSGDSRLLSSSHNVVDKPVYTPRIPHTAARCGPGRRIGWVTVRCVVRQNCKCSEVEVDYFTSMQTTWHIRTQIRLQLWIFFTSCFQRGRIMMFHIFSMKWTKKLNKEELIYYHCAEEGSYLQFVFSSFISAQKLQE